MNLYVIYFQKESKSSILERKKEEERMQRVEEELNKKRENWNQEENDLYFSTKKIELEDNIEFATTFDQLNEIIAELIEPKDKEGDLYKASKSVASASFIGKYGKVFWREV